MPAVVPWTPQFVVSIYFSNLRWLELWCPQALEGGFDSEFFFNKRNGVGALRKKLLYRRHHFATCSLRLLAQYMFLCTSSVIASRGSELANVLNSFGNSSDCISGPSRPPPAYRTTGLVVFFLSVYSFFSSFSVPPWRLGFVRLGHFGPSSNEKWQHT